MGRCKDCQNAEEYRNGIYCSYYRQVYDPYDGCTDHFVARYGSTGGGCFLTTACVEAKGLPDDCYELTVFRKFRDTYLKSTAEGSKDVRTYYRVAPRIVDAINQEPNALAWYEEIYCELITPVLCLIENERYEDAWQNYRQYVQKLCEQFNVSDQD